MRNITRDKTNRTPNGTPTPTPMATVLSEGDDCLDEGVTRVGKVIGDAEDTEMPDEAFGRLADVEDVGMLEEMIEREEMVASDGDVEDEPLASVSDLNRSPVPPSVKIDVLQQLMSLSGSNTLSAQQNLEAKVPSTVGQGIMLL